MQVANYSVVVLGAAGAGKTSLCAAVARAPARFRSGIDDEPYMAAESINLYDTMGYTKLDQNEALQLSARLLWISEQAAVDAAIIVIRADIPFCWRGRGAFLRAIRILRNVLGIGPNRITIVVTHCELYSESTATAQFRALDDVYGFSSIGIPHAIGGSLCNIEQVAPGLQAYVGAMVAGMLETITKNILSAV